MDWINETGINITTNLDNLLGFIYRIDLVDGRYYYGRKQLWNKRGRQWYESDWKEYKSSSRTILEGNVDIERKSILAVFQSKSSIRYAEAAAIICSGSYLNSDKGLNGEFAGCKGRLSFSEQDREQLRRLEEHCVAWRRMNAQDPSDR